MKKLFKVFVALEPGTDFEDFMDHNVCKNGYVEDADYIYGDEFNTPNVIFYELPVRKQYDASMIARCIFVTGKLGIRKGRLYRVSIGGENATLDDFIQRCTK